MYSVMYKLSEYIYTYNIHTFTYQKALLHTLLLLVFKIVGSLQSILKVITTKSKHDKNFRSKANGIDVVLGVPREDAKYLLI